MLPHSGLRPRTPIRRTFRQNTMSITINTNTTATIASQNLNKSNAALRTSLNRLSSGKQIVNPADDAGGLAVSMKLTAALSRSAGVDKISAMVSAFYKLKMGHCQ